MKWSKAFFKGLASSKVICSFSFVSNDYIWSSILSPNKSILDSPGLVIKDLYNLGLNASLGKFSTSMRSYIGQRSLMGLGHQLCLPSKAFQPHTSMASSTSPGITHLASLMTIVLLIYLFQLKVNIGGSELFLHEVLQSGAFHVLPPHAINSFSYVITEGGYLLLTVI